MYTLNTTINSIEKFDPLSSVILHTDDGEVSFEMYQNDSETDGNWNDLITALKVQPQPAIITGGGNSDVALEVEWGEDVQKVARIYGNPGEVFFPRSAEKITMKEKKYVNEEGQFDFKKFVTDGALEKNLNEAKNIEEGIHDMDMTAADHTSAGKRTDMSPQEETLRSPIAQHKLRPLLRKFEGLKYEDIIKMAEIDNLSKEEIFDVDYMEDRIRTHLEIKEIKEQGPRPKRKHRKNPTRFGRGSHGKIPHFDDAIDASEPSFPYGVDNPEETSDNASKARKAAKAMGLGPELEKAEYEMHFGRGGGGDRSGEQDPFRWKKSNKRVTKGGKLHKQDLKVAKQDSKRSLDILRKNKAFKKSQGDYLPEDLQNEVFDRVDEKLKLLRESEGMIDAAMVEELLEDFVETMQIQGVAIDDIGPKEITQFMKFGKSNALKALGTEYK